jgi:hypothetical protein
MVRSTAMKHVKDGKFHLVARFSLHCFFDNTLSAATLIMSHGALVSEALDDPRAQLFTAWQAQPVSNYHCAATLMEHECYWRPRRRQQHF